MIDEAEEGRMNGGMGVWIEVLPTEPIAAANGRYVLGNRKYPPP